MCFSYYVVLWKDIFALNKPNQIIKTVDKKNIDIENAIITLTQLILKYFMIVYIDS